MTNMINATSPELKKFLAPDEVKPTKSGAMEVHGLLTPGVVLMRNLRFPAKSLVICAMFLIPLLVFGWFYNSSMLATINFSAKERLGVAYVRETFSLLQLAQELRNDASAATKISAAQAKLAALDKRIGQELGTEAALQKVNQAFAQTQAGGVDADTAFKLHTAHVEALIHLITVATDASNLTLDPDLDSYFLMDAALFRVPDIIENTEKLRNMGLRIMKSGTITSAQQRIVSELIPIAEFQHRNMRDGLAKSFAANPELVGKLHVTQALDGTSAFFALARKSVIDSQDFSPAAQAKVQDGASAVIKEQYQLSQRLLDELDVLLAKRIDGSKTILFVVNSIALVSILLAAYFFYAFYTVTLGGLLVISKHLHEMAQGDLHQCPAKPWGHDEPADVIEDLRKAYHALHELIRVVRHSARALHATSEAISATSFDLSARTESAAASLEQQASAMDQIGAIVGNTSDRAKAAADFATSNASVAEQGGKVIASVVETMQNIHGSSSKISDIIGVIDGIAFQTNILALNAAVEAARAGEAGRGFAVVATEVRGLAQRSAQAAREIKDLISHSVDQISSGKVIVEKAGSTMSQMVMNAAKINSYLSEISVASKEQADGVAQAAKTIQILDESTRHNASLVEQTASASAALTKQALGLQQEIGNFRVV